jgi:hypothetical protein
MTSRYVTVDPPWTEEHGLTIACRYCGAVGALPRPGREPDVQHFPLCTRAEAAAFQRAEVEASRLPKDSAS